MAGHFGVPGIAPHIKKALYAELEHSKKKIIIPTLAKTGISTSIIEETPSPPSFYALVPLKDQNRINIGMLCVMDSSKKKLSAQHKKVLLKYGQHITRVLIDKKKNLQLRDDLRVLKEQITLFELTNKQAKIGSWHLDLPTKKLYWSNTTKAIHEVPTDYKPELETAIKFYKAGESREKIEKCIENAILHHKKFDVELQVITAKGKEIWVRARGQAEFENGECIHLYGTFQNINLDKIKEKKLAFKENQFRSIIENSLTAHLLTKPDGSIIQANKAAIKMFGYGKKEFLSLDRGKVIDTSDPRLPILLEKRKIEGKVEGELIGIRKNGQKFAILLSSSLFMDLDGVIKTSMSIIDISSEKQKSQELANSEQLYRSITENSSDIVCHHKPDGTYTYVTPSFSYKFGYTLDEVIGSDPYTYFHPDDKRRIKEEAHKKSLQGVEIEPIKYRFKKKDGSFLWVETISKPIMESGTVTSLLTSTRVIQKRVELEKELAHTLDIFRTSFNNAPIGMVLVGPDGKFLRVNNNLCTLLGYTEQELKQCTFSDITHPKDLKKHVLPLGQLINGEVKSIQLEKRYITKEGNALWVNLSVSKVSNLDGSLRHFIGQMENITQRKKAQQQLFKEKERLQNILEGTNAGTWEWNIKTGSTVFDSRWAEIVGYTLEELAPVNIETWSSLAHPEDLIVSNAKLRACFNKETDYYEVEVRMKHKQGHWVWILSRGKVTSWSAKGEALKMSGTHSDITRTKEFEDSLKKLNMQLQKNAKLLEASNAELEQFAYIASHDLKEPLRMVRSFIDLLEKKIRATFG